MPSLKDIPALVTGAGRGIGRAIAERLAAEGAAVTLLARTQTDIDAVAAGIRDRGADALALACDVTQPGEVGSAFAAAAERFGPIRLLVNNAGTPGPFGPIGVVDPQQWWASQHLHQYAPLLTMSAVLPGMQHAGGGRIINIVSSAGTRPVLHMSGYALGKCAAIRLTETVDLEQRANSIRAFALQPGTIITDMAHATLRSAEAQRWIPEGIAMLNARTPEQSAGDLARCCAVVAALAAGQYDALSGRYLDVAWDLNALLHEAAKTR
jgi:NAD(P)-dependent dehydrogenase (short-subunit alcohol dehydrogenase family)